MSQTTKPGKRISSRQHERPSIKDERGVALILALIMLLVMSVIATTVSFNSNKDYQAMSNYKRGQEAFLAAERCIQLGRNRFEVVGIEVLYFLLQNKDTVSLGREQRKSPLPGRGGRGLRDR